jgi:hypothetical protein
MEKLGVFLSALGLLVVTAILLAWPTQWLWNNVLIGAVDGIHPIGFWQALGINILFNMLFKNNK